MFPDNVKVYDLFSANSSSSSISVSNSSSQSSVVIMSNCASTSIRKRVRNTFACFFNSSTSMEILRDLLNASLIIRSAFFSASLIINFDSFVALPDQFSPITHDSKHFDKKQQRPGVDAHYYAKAVYDYYLNTHDRNSYDDNAADINSVVHFDKNYNNAAWTGQYMVYGDGDGQTFNPLSGAKDIVAHE